MQFLQIKKSSLFFNKLIYRHLSVAGYVIISSTFLFAVTYSDNAQSNTVLAIDISFINTAIDI